MDTNGRQLAEIAILALGGRSRSDSESDFGSIGSANIGG
jgi:hypothetical protein